MIEIIVCCLAFGFGLLSIVFFLFMLGPEGSDFNGLFLISITITIISSVIMNQYLKKAKKEQLERLGISEEEERIRREKILEERKIQIENEQIQNRNDYNDWVQRVKNNKIYLDKEYIHIDKVGFIWFENEKYYLYMYGFSEEYYKWGYYDGVIVADEIELIGGVCYTTTEEKNNKLVGAVVGGILGGTTGAIIGQNVNNGTKQVYHSTDNYYLKIDNHMFVISSKDYVFLTEYIKINDSKKNI